MEMYCESCKTVFDNDTCPYCGSKKVRLPAYNDYCYLKEMDYMWGKLLEDALKDSGIPAVSFMPRGKALVRRNRQDRVAIYVPYEFFDTAKEIDGQLFSEEDVTEE